MFRHHLIGSCTLFKITQSKPKKDTPSSVSNSAIMIKYNYILNISKSDSYVKMCHQYVVFLIDILKIHHISIPLSPFKVLFVFPFT